MNDRSLQAARARLVPHFYLHRQLISTLGRYLLPLLLATLLVSCGGSKPPRFERLPLNIIVRVPGMVGVIPAVEGSHLNATLRALGVRSYTLPLATLQRVDPMLYSTVIIDEGAMEDDRVAAFYNTLQENVYKGLRLVILRQSPEVMQKLRARYRYLVLPREVEYSVQLVAPFRTHSILTHPNPVGPVDLDSLARRTSQLALGGTVARAVLAGNAQRPDSSAALLEEPIGRGWIWYCAFPLTERAAAGFDAERKIIANVLSRR